MVPGIVAILGTIAGAVLGAILTHTLSSKGQTREMKLDVLRRVMGYRYCVGKTYLNQESLDNHARIEMNRVLNEAAIVFHSNTKVVEILKASWEGSMESKLASLVREMGEDLNLDLPTNLEDLVRNSLFLEGGKELIA
ncbi:MAG: hypothetical protein OXL40_14410 [Bacteroidota bacterium]|nr:hypothetical protein [Bacteroidota bacterium]